MLQCLARLQILDRRLGAGEIGLRLGDASAVIVVLDLDQQIALLDLLKVVDRHPSDITLDLGAERCDVTADVGVVRGLPHAVTDPAVPAGDEQRNDDAGEQQNCNRYRKAAKPPPQSLYPINVNNLPSD